VSEETQYVTQSEGPERPFVETGLALQAPDGRIVPIVFSEVTLGERCDVPVDGLAPRRLQVEGSTLVHEGKKFALGDTFEGFKVVPFAVTATLQGCNEPYHDRTWPVGYQPVTLVGRMGRRVNDVELNDKTISRTQARLESGPQGISLVAESPTFVNGESLEIGTARLLKDGDLIRFSNIIFRYQVGAPQTAASSDNQVKLSCLGGFKVEAPGVAGSAADWRSHTARFVLAYLAAEWPRQVALEPLLEAFWPDLDEERARGNLRVTIHKIRRSLPLPEGGPALFERTTYTMGIHPELNFWHDILEFQKAVDEKNWRKALDLYGGKYLEECYMDWAESIRARLESQCLEAGLNLVQETPVGPERLEIARRCLKLDPCCQPAVLAAMETSRLLGRPEEALKLYESFRKTLESTLGLEPSMDLLREEQLARLHIG
jgi:DNA-binding SARP family transcriptional activator